MSKRGSVLVPEAPTMDTITKKSRGGVLRIGHDGRFQPLMSGACAGAPEGREQRNRRWSPRVNGEGVKIFAVSEMGSRLTSEFQKELPEVELLKPVGEMITTAQGATDLLEKVRIDIDVGLADVPVLYQPLYERVDGPFPGG